MGNYIYFFLIIKLLAFSPASFSSENHNPQWYPSVIFKIPDFNNLGFTESSFFDSGQFYISENGVLNTSPNQAGFFEETATVRLTSEIKAIKVQNTFLLISTISLGSMLALFFAVSVMYLRRQKKMKEKERQRLASEKSAIESELKEAAAQLYAFTLSIWEKNKLIEAYTAELKNASGVSENYYKQEHEQNMQQLLQATLLTDDQWDSFRQVFDKVHPGYISRLNETVPNLSPAETRYFVLSKLNLSSKEMAAMLGIGQDSIRQYRSRLRRKLNIISEDGLHELVSSI